MELVVVAIGIPLGVVAVLVAGDELARRVGWAPVAPGNLPNRGGHHSNAFATLAGARAQLNEGLIIVAPNMPSDARPRSALEPGDEFYRQLQAGIRADPGTFAAGAGEQIHAQMRRFVRQGDVLARQLVSVSEFGSNWALFTAPAVAGWKEQIDWCIRLRYEPGEEDAFAYGLWRLDREPSGDSLDLPHLDDSVVVTPENGASLIDPRPWQDLLIPLRTQWAGVGPYGARVTMRDWQILPESGVCDAARNEAAAAASQAVASGDRGNS